MGGTNISQNNATFLVHSTFSSSITSLNKDPFSHWNEKTNRTIVDIWTDATKDTNPLGGEGDSFINNKKCMIRKSSETFHVLRLNRVSSLIPYKF